MDRKHCGKRKKLLVTSNFSFSHNVFKRLVLQTRKNQGLFGKGLKWLTLHKIRCITLEILYLTHSGLSSANATKAVQLLLKSMCLKMIKAVQYCTELFTNIGGSKTIYIYCYDKFAHTDPKNKRVHHFYR